MQAPTMPIRQSKYDGMQSDREMPMLANGSLPASFEQAGRKFGGIWKLFFFTAAVCVTASAIVGFFASLAKGFSIFDVINQVYLFIFGVLMLVVDLPVDFTQRLVAAKMTIYKYLLFMTRFTGRGIWYLFLACMIIGSLCDNGLCEWLGVVLGLYVAAVGAASTFQGCMKSIKLERVRGRVNGRINELAALLPPSGMTKDQFGAMSAELVADSKFTDEDLNYIVNALSCSTRSEESECISRREFAEWTRGSMTVL
eukprot:GEMP01026732.1.p1 GENE.GEMP01026732.1~~GEMP01026732.1.p1  ORF type:complete len:267 (+),score=63.86 GEMP01026732.1:39-803(+)